MAEREKLIFSVGQVNEYIKYLMEADAVLDSIWVRGEISNLTARHTTGHLYFSLKDETGVLRAVMFRSSAVKLKFEPENGMRVLAHGRVSVYPKDGQYQLYLDSMEPDGIGALAAAYEQLKNKLAAEGLFDEAHKKPLPAYPETVGVITSPTGAAVRDIANILSRRYPLAKMILFPTLVQGENAPRQLCSGIRYFNQKLPVDVIIIGRGGGSLEELWAFNDETLARTVAASQIPVISAVGHETDFTICDFAADCRAPTPSAAAELAVPDSAELRKQTDALYSMLRTHITNRIASERRYVSMLASKRVLSSPDAVVRDRRLQLDTLAARMDAAASRVCADGKQTVTERSSALDRAMERRLHAAQTRFSAQAAKLGALNPLAVLSRGYSAVFDENSGSVRSVSQLSEGETVRIRFSDGTADAEIRALHEIEERTDASHG